MRVDCPPAVEYDKRFGCKFWVYQGTNVSVQINFTNGRVIDFDIEGGYKELASWYSHKTMLSDGTDYFSKEKYLKL